MKARVYPLVSKSAGSWKVWPCWVLSRLNKCILMGTDISLYLWVPYVSLVHRSQIPSCRAHDLPLCLQMLCKRKIFLHFALEQEVESENANKKSSAVHCLLAFLLLPPVGSSSSCESRSSLSTSCNKAKGRRSSLWQRQSAVKEFEYCWYLQ